MPEEMKPAYLMIGSDAAKLDSALARLRARAEREGGPGALESFPGAGGSGPDADALIAAMPAMSLMAERRYLLADGVERWRAPQVKAVAAALAEAPPEVTVVLICHDKSAPKGLEDAVKKAGGDVHAYAAPSKRDLGPWLIAGARKRGFTLAPQAARTMVARLGEGTVRLSTELDRIAVWAGDGGEVDGDDIEMLVADTSERAGWTLGDAIIARDTERAVEAAEALTAQGEAVTPLVYGMASRLRSAHLAAAGLEAGRSPSDVQAGLKMNPYAAKMLVQSVKGTSAAELSEAIAAIADLEWWTRGGSDYTERVALTLAVRRAAGAEAA